jgi:hypothetical protein
MTRHVTCILIAVTLAAATDAARSQTPAAVWENYDFVPGSKLLTDNVGTPAANLALSDARAAAVKASLVSQYGAEGARITTQGLGDTKPALPNTTAEGRAQNRRVELVKQ